MKQFLFSLPYHPESKCGIPVAWGVKYRNEVKVHLMLLKHGAVTLLNLPSSAFIAMTQ